MCGINGVFKFNKIDGSDIEKLLTMNKNMIYRGPDENDIWYDNKMGLAQVRLSIIGVENGHQPIFNEDKTLAIICNGEIYNYKELKEDLIKRGHKFTTDSDTEVILHLFEEKQEKCLDDFRGMYAIAIYNTVEKKLFLARDICGKKPLYYAQLPQGIVFSSEITAIKDNFLIDFDVDFGQIKDYLKHSYSQSMQKTHIKQIKRLESGEYAFIDDNGIRLNRYWKKINTYSYKGTYEQAKKEALEILKQSVDLRLRSDVPIAILLSGGIDSSAIASLASETHDNIHAITVGYKGCPDCDERALAKRLAEEKGLIWHEIELDEDDYVQYFEEYTKYIDEPVCDLASIAQWGIYKKAKKLGFTVLLSGNGGDEIFYGYPTHNQLGENMDTLSELANLKRKPRKYIEYFLKNYNKMYKLMRTYDHKSYLNFYYPNYSKLNFEWDDNFDFNQDNYREKYYNEEKYGTDKVYSYLFNVWLTNNCYYLSDKLAMGNSLEIRAPFSDRKLIEFISSLPLEYKYHTGNAKGFLKDILKDIVPDYILNAQKRGFTPPQNSINTIIDNYKSKYFKTKLTGYNQILVDKFLDEKVKKDVSTDSIIHI